MPRPPTVGSLPPWCSRWLGHRVAPAKPLPKWLVHVWSFVGAFCGLSVLLGLYSFSDYFVQRGVPIIVASYVRHYHTRAHAHPPRVAGRRVV